VWEKCGEKGRTATVLSAGDMSREKKRRDVRRDQKKRGGKKFLLRGRILTLSRKGRNFKGGHLHQTGDLLGVRKEVSLRLHKNGGEGGETLHLPQGVERGKKGVQTADFNSVGGLVQGGERYFAMSRWGEGDIECD